MAGVRSVDDKDSDDTSSLSGKRPWSANATIASPSLVDDWELSVAMFPVNVVVEEASILLPVPTTQTCSFERAGGSPE
jgi:hypothetical protein